MHRACRWCWWHRHNTTNTHGASPLCTMVHRPPSAAAAATEAAAEPTIRSTNLMRSRRSEVDESKSTKQSRARRVRLATLQCFSKSNNPARDQQNRQRACMNKQSGTQLENVRFLEKPAAQQQSDTTEEAMQAQYTDTPV